MKVEFIFPTFRLNDSYLCSLHVQTIYKERYDYRFYRSFDIQMCDFDIEFKSQLID
jgi:hypothetical protein